MNYKQALIEFHNALYEKTDLKHNQPGYGLDELSETLRCNLIEEEMQELLEAIAIYIENKKQPKYLLEVRKELCDLLYVTFGTAVVFGLPVDEDFAKVHENNMLKIKNGTIREDGKLVKPVDHPKVQLD